MDKQNTDRRRRQADRLDNIALVGAAVLVLCIASVRTPETTEASAALAPAVMVVALEQGRAR